MAKKNHITSSHPRFNEAKAEEISRIRREANPQGYESTPEKQARLAQELVREMEEESNEAVEEEAPTMKKLKKMKKMPKSKPTRWKKRSHRHVSPEKVEEKRNTGRRIIFEDPTLASTQSQITFHGTPVELKEEPIEFEDLVFPKFIIEAEKRSKKREQVKKAQQGPIKLNVAPKVAKPVENKADFLGFSEVARSAVLKKIEEIKSSWNSPDSLPRKLKIPFNGQKIHLQPCWMMEFKDDKGCRRFFRIEDQLSKASTRYLRWLQGKLDPKIAEEDAFYRKLQDQIEANYAKEGRQKIRPPREKKRN
ncbi:hypothetical protein POM88_035441 [Heracleum sosnowskyi]|uniref:Uncharacterized protein n=1 Tax=Heracleum sosnowskyi TaxID=360622 RepID=A0AAD8ME44_9APIA|nr:hypothetical protein POM88_035441 [Heracleum sosnowskyi]